MASVESLASSPQGAAPARGLISSVQFADLSDDTTHTFVREFAEKASTIHDQRLVQMKQKPRPALSSRLLEDQLREVSFSSDISGEDEFGKRGECEGLEAGEEGEGTGDKRDDNPSIVCAPKKLKKVDSMTSMTLKRISDRVINTRRVFSKSVEGDDPYFEGKAMLTNEYNLLQTSLRDVSAVPKLITMETDFESGKETLFLEYIDGSLLSNWIEADSIQMPAPSTCNKETSEFRKRRTERLRTAIRMMHAIAAALAKVHKAGVYHNGLSASSIVVEEEKNHEEDDEQKNNDEDEKDVGNESRFSVKLVNFGFASLVAEAEMTDEGEAINDDMYTVGEIFCQILYALFSISDTDNNSSGGSGDNFAMDAKEVSAFLEGTNGMNDLPKHLVEKISALLQAEVRFNPKVPRVLNRVQSAEIDAPCSSASDLEAYLECLLASEDAVLLPVPCLLKEPCFRTQFEITTDKQIIAKERRKKATVVANSVKTKLAFVPGSCNLESNASPVATIEDEAENLVVALLQNLSVKDRRHGLKYYRQCFVGSKAVSYMVQAGFAKTRGQAIEICTLLNEEYDVFEHVLDNHAFADMGYFYHFKPYAVLKYGTMMLNGPMTGYIPCETDAIYGLARVFWTKNPATFSASDAVTSLVETGYASSRSEAVQLGTFLQISFGMFQCLKSTSSLESGISPDAVFRDASISFQYNYSLKAQFEAQGSSKINDKKAASILQENLSC